MRPHALPFAILLSVTAACGDIVVSEVEDVSDGGADSGAGPADVADDPDVSRPPPDVDGTSDGAVEPPPHDVGEDAFKDVPEVPPDVIEDAPSEVGDDVAFDDGAPHDVEADAPEPECLAASDCPDPEQVCRTAACVDGSCEVAIPVGVACDDQDGCTEGDVCQVDGVCAGAWSGVCECQTDGDCAFLDAPCGVGRCEQESKSCVLDPEPRLGDACDDGDPCTFDDGCQADGQCQGTAYSCGDGLLPCQQTACNGAGGCLAPEVKPGSCLIEGQCYEAGDAMPVSPCLVCDPLADPTGPTQRPDGTACDADGDGCTAGDACKMGVCAPGPAVECPSPSASCRVASCKSTGSESYSCTESTKSGWCFIGGVCRSSGELNPSNACMACSPSKSTTAFSPRASGTSCGSSTSNQCTKPDTCDGKGTCQPNHMSAGTACGDSTDGPCTNPDSCDGKGTCKSNDPPNGTSCGTCKQCISKVCTNVCR